MTDKKQKILSSIDGTCPYCGSNKVGPVGGVAARPSSSTKLPEAKAMFLCDNCKKLFLPKK